MRSSSVVLLALLLSQSAAQAEDQPKYAAHVTRLVRSHDYLTTHPAPDFWKLIGYYTGGDCGPASLTMVLNAMRSDGELKRSDKLITRDELGGTIKLYVLG